MKSTRKYVGRIKLDLLIFLSPSTLVSMLIICTLQTVNYLSKNWNSGSSIGNVIFQLYGGIVWYEFITPDAAAFWLLQLLPCGMAFSSFMSRSMNNQLSLIAYRYKSQTAWWISKVLANLIGCFLIALLSGLLCGVISYLDGLQDLRVTMQDADGFRILSISPVLLALLAYALQMGLLTGFGMLTYLITRDTKIGLLSYLLPAAWSIMQFSGDDLVLVDNRHRIINYGMAKRFSFNGSFGINITEAICGSLLYIIIFALLGALVQQWVVQTQRRAR